MTTTTTSTTDPSGKPVPAVEAVIDFDKNASIFAKGYPTCDAAATAKMFRPKRPSKPAKRRRSAPAKRTALTADRRKAWQR